MAIIDPTFTPPPLTGANTPILPNETFEDWFSRINSDFRNPVTEAMAAKVWQFKTNPEMFQRRGEPVNPGGQVVPPQAQPFRHPIQRLPQQPSIEQFDLMRARQGQPRQRPRPLINPDRDRLQSIPSQQVMPLRTDRQFNIPSLQRPDFANFFSSLQSRIPQLPTAKTRELKPGVLSNISARHTRELR